MEQWAGHGLNILRRTGESFNSLGRRSTRHLLCSPEARACVRQSCAAATHSPATAVCFAPTAPCHVRPSRKGTSPAADRQLRVRRGHGETTSVTGWHGIAMSVAATWDAVSSGQKYAAMATCWNSRASRARSEIQRRWERRNFIRGSWQVVGTLVRVTGRSDGKFQASA